MKSSRQPLFAVAFAGVLMLAGCQALAPGGGGSGPIKLGLTAPKTGGLARYTDGFLQGARIAVEEANAAGGVNGRQLELVERDNKSTNEDSIESLRQLALEDRVSAVISQMSSAACLAVAGEAALQKMPYVESCMADALTYQQGNKYTFRVHLNTWLQGAAAADLVAAKFPNAKRIYLLASDYEFGHSLSTRFRERLKEVKKDAEIVGEAYPKVAESNYAPYISALLGARPDVVMVNIAIVGPFFTQALSSGLMEKTKVLSPAWGSMDELSLLKKEQIPVGAWAAGIPWYAITGNPKNDAFVKKTKEKFSKDPVTSDYFGYLSTLFAIEGIRKAGSTDADKIIAAMEGLSIDSPVGKLSVGKESHQARISYWFGEVKWDDAKGYGVLAGVSTFSGDKLLPTEEQVQGMRKK